MTLPMVTCPLCCRPGFSTSDSLCSALVDVTTRKLCCPICNHIVLGLDKFTIHLFSHSLNKFGVEQEKETIQICEADDTTSSSTNVKSNSSNSSIVDGESNNSIFKLQNSVNYKIGPDELTSKKSEMPPDWRVSSTNVDAHKSVNIPDSSLICFRADNGQLFALSPESLGTSLKNVTINTQNYITNTNITTSTVQTRVVEKVQKRKYSQVFENENSGVMNKNIEVNSPDNYSNVESVNSWPSTPSVSSDADKPFNAFASEREFESCKDLLTKGDFSTLTDEIGELDIKRESSLTDSVVSDDFNDDSEDRKDDDRKKEGLNCELCPFVFPNKTILAMHKQLIHKKVEVEIENKRKLLVCNLCPRTFSLRSSLMIHRKVAHAGGFGNSENGVSVKQVISKPACQICGKFFKKEIHLAQHMKAHDEKQWQCTICSKTFTTKYFLKKHRRLHTGETPYKCNKCGKAFTFQQSYHKHLLYHNDEKPYCCAQCGRLFKELSTLHNHERIHSGEKPFSCETCGKAFRQRVSYLVHRRIHTGAMPYKCTACNKTFRYKISQRTHKCPAQPPGVVVRTNGSLVERLQAAMTKAGEEIDQNPALEGTASPKSECVEISSKGRDGSSVNQDVIIESPPNSVLPPTSTLTEKVSPENQMIRNPEKNIEELHIEKPQIYLLVKGPNDETYYQPLIISQNLGVNNNPKRDSLMPKIVSNTNPYQSNTNQSSFDNKKTLKVISGKEIITKCKKDINAVSSKCSTQKSNNLKLNIEVVPKFEKCLDSQTAKSPEVGNIVKKNHEDLIHNNSKLFENPGEINLECLNSKSSEATMDEILRNFSNELVQSQFNYQNDEKTSVDQKAELSSDLIMMEPPDMFSFILSPSLTSPSDRLEKLSLSPNSAANQQSAIDNFDTPGVFSGNIISSTDGQQDSLFDTISDDALKEFLFGTSNSN